MPFFVIFLLSCLFFFFFNPSQANRLQTLTYYSQDRWEQYGSSHLLARKWRIIFLKIFKVHPVFFNLGPVSWLLWTTIIEIGVVLSESAAAGSNKTGCSVVLTIWTRLLCVHSCFCHLFLATGVCLVTQKCDTVYKVPVVFQSVLHFLFSLVKVTCYTASYLLCYTTATLKAKLSPKCNLGFIVIMLLHEGLTRVYSQKKSLGCILARVLL